MTRVVGSPLPASEICGEHSGSPRQFELGERIRKSRDEAGLSQEVLALKAGISRTQLTRLEAGRGNPTIHTLCELVIVLDVDIGDFLAHLQESEG